MQRTELTPRRLGYSHGRLKGPRFSIGRKLDLYKPLRLTSPTSTTKPDAPKPTAPTTPKEESDVLSLQIHLSPLEQEELIQESETAFQGDEHLKQLYPDPDVFGEFTGSVHMLIRGEKVSREELKKKRIDPNMVWSRAHSRVSSFASDKAAEKRKRFQRTRIDETLEKKRARRFKSF